MTVRSGAMVDTLTSPGDTQRDPHVACVQCTTNKYDVYVGNTSHTFNSLIMK